MSEAQQERDDSRLSRDQKAQESEEIARLTRNFLASGGKVEAVGAGERPAFSWDGEWLDVAAAAKRLKIPVTQLKNGIMNGTLESRPAPVSHIRGCRRMWSAAILDAWVERYRSKIKKTQRRKAHDDQGGND